MAYFETPDLPQPKALPNVLVGAASPLWAYFATAAAGGVAFWWMTRWTRPANLEALFAAAAPVAEPMVEAVEALAEIPVAVVEDTAEIAVATQPESLPVAETQPELAAASDAGPEPEPRLAVVAEAAPVAETEPVIEAAPAPVAEPATEPTTPAKPRVRKSAASDGANGVQP